MRQLRIHIRLRERMNFISDYLSQQVVEALGNANSLLVLSRFEELVRSFGSHEQQKEARLNSVLTHVYWLALLASIVAMQSSIFKFVSRGNVRLDSLRCTLVVRWFFHIHFPASETPCGC